MGEIITPQPESFGSIEQRLNAEGYHFYGLESLTTFQFQQDAKFQTVQDKTEDEIIRECEDFYLQQGIKVEVKLVEKEGLSEGQRSVYVFVKQKDEKRN